MSGDRCRGCARILTVIGVLLLAPIALLYVAWIAAYDLTGGSRRKRRQARAAGVDPDRGSSWPVLVALSAVLIIVLVRR
jgi:hypothetical protein